MMTAHADTKETAAPIGLLDSTLRMMTCRHIAITVSTCATERRAAGTTPRCRFLPNPADAGMAKPFTQA